MRTRGKKKKKYVELDNDDREAIACSESFYAAFICDGCEQNFASAQGLGGHKRV